MQITRDKSFYPFVIRRITLDGNSFHLLEDVLIHYGEQYGNDRYPAMKEQRRGNNVYGEDFRISFLPTTSVNYLAEAITRHWGWLPSDLRRYCHAIGISSVLTDLAENSSVPQYSYLELIAQTAAPQPPPCAQSGALRGRQRPCASSCPAHNGL